MRAIGYDADFDLARGSTGADRAPPRADPGLAAVESRSTPGATVRVPRGVELDLGSTGKALAADLAAEAAARRAPGRGRRPRLPRRRHRDRRRAARRRLADPRRRGQRGPGRRRRRDRRDPTGRDRDLEHDRPALASRRPGHLHHLVDPRTGAPVESPWRTVVRRRGHVRRREHRRDRRDRPRRRRARLARATAASPPGSSRSTARSSASAAGRAAGRRRSS